MCLVLSARMVWQMQAPLRCQQSLLPCQLPLLHMLACRSQTAPTKPSEATQQHPAIVELPGLCMHALPLTTTTNKSFSSQDMVPVNAYKVSSRRGAGTEHRKSPAVSISQMAELRSSTSVQLPSPSSHTRRGSLAM